MLMLVPWFMVIVRMRAVGMAGGGHADLAQRAQHAAVHGARALRLPHAAGDRACRAASLLRHQEPEVRSPWLFFFLPCETPSAWTKGPNGIRRPPPKL